MELAISEKFSQNLTLEHKLLETIDADIVDNSSHAYWGIGKNGEGANKLGKLIIQTRSQLFVDLQEKLRNDNYDLLSEKHLSEELLLKIATALSSDRKKIIADIFQRLTIEHTNAFDWNVASLMQHFPPYDVIDEFKKHEAYSFHKSSGLCWMFGKFGISDSQIISFLRDIIAVKNNWSAWWAAAFALSEITKEDAITTLKHSVRNDFKYQNLSSILNDLGSKRSVVGVLLKADSENIRREIFPALKNQFLTTTNESIKLNCLWLFGRLRLIDKTIYEKIELLLENPDSYQLKYYTLFALGENITEKYVTLLLKYLDDSDPLIRKLAARGLSYIGTTKYLTKLYSRLFIEQDYGVVAQLTKAIYNAKNPHDKLKLRLYRSIYENENGLIGDETDKWYADPSIYDIFSESQDPENICFNLILQLIDHYNIKVLNPIDLATGTGKLMRRILEYIDYSGSLYVVDLSEHMLKYVEKFINRSNFYAYNIEREKTALVDLNLPVNSSLIVSSFGFPSKIFNKEQCCKELSKVHDHLTDDGLFITIGWDETFNDELNLMWYKFIKDDIVCKNFDEWRKKRTEKIHSARNCNLTWFKKGVVVPLQFKNINESAYVMGHLFGRDAKKYILSNNIIQMTMSMGITCNTKSELKAILEEWKK